MAACLLQRMLWNMAFPHAVTNLPLPTHRWKLDLAASSVLAFFITRTPLLKCWSYSYPRIWDLGEDWRQKCALGHGPTSPFQNKPGGHAGSWAEILFMLQTQEWECLKPRVNIGQHRKVQPQDQKVQRCLVPIHHLVHTSECCLQGHVPIRVRFHQTPSITTQPESQPDNSHA